MLLGISSALTMLCILNFSFFAWRARPTLILLTVTLVWLKIWSWRFGYPLCIVPPKSVEGSKQSFGIKALFQICIWYKALKRCRKKGIWNWGQTISDFARNEESTIKYLPISSHCHGCYVSLGVIIIDNLPKSKGNSLYFSSVWWHWEKCLYVLELV